jgi:hypothetical protein
VGRRGGPALDLTSASAGVRTHRPAPLSEHHRRTRRDHVVHPLVQPPPAPGDGTTSGRGLRARGLGRDAARRSTARAELRALISAAPNLTDHPCNNTSGMIESAALPNVRGWPSGRSGWSDYAVPDPGVGPPQCAGTRVASAGLTRALCAATTTDDRPCVGERLYGMYLLFESDERGCDGAGSWCWP